jgi:hypothetical protein
MLSGVARLVFNRFAARVAAAGEPWITTYRVRHDIRNLVAAGRDNVPFQSFPGP